MSIFWETNYQEALEKSIKEAKPILLLFSKPG